MHASENVDIISLVVCRDLKVVAILKCHLAGVNMALANAATALAAEDPRLGEARELLEDVAVDLANRVVSISQHKFL
jgi:hypothetical protein